MTRRRIKVLIGSVVILLVAAAVGTNAYALINPPNQIKTHPAPQLFDAATIDPIGQEIATQRTQAEEVFTQWSTTHHARDDAAFTSFVLAHIPAPPSPAEQNSELAQLRALAQTRTPAQDAAATWLETYGRKDVWKVYLSDATELSTTKIRKQDKAELKATRTLAGTLTTAAQQRFNRQAPTVIEPSLRPGSPRKAKLSYPSKHTVYVAAEQTVLTRLDPGRTDDFTTMVNQVAYSRLYAAGHYPSDLLAGAFVGYLIGDYELNLQ
jgi:hypothetical protein